jgi:hypothetical protein
MVITILVIDSSTNSKTNVGNVGNVGNVRNVAGPNSAEAM